MSLSEKIIAGPLGRVCTVIATLGPLGTRMKAPGTWGSGAGLLLYTVVLARYNELEHWAVFLGICTALIIVAIAICTLAEKHIGRTDPGEVILDEFVAMPLVFIGAEGVDFLRAKSQWVWVWVLVGFMLFRFFDVMKPFGIKKLQALPGGFGIVVDDLAAAGAACVVLHVLHWVSRLVF